MHNSNSTQQRASHVSQQLANLMDMKSFEDGNILWTERGEYLKLVKTGAWMQPQLNRVWWPLAVSMFYKRVTHLNPVLTAGEIINQFVILPPILRITNTLNMILCLSNSIYIFVILLLSLKL